MTVTIVTTATTPAHPWTRRRGPVKASVDNAIPSNAKDAAVLRVIGGKCGSTWMRARVPDTQPTSTARPRANTNTPEPAANRVDHGASATDSIMAGIPGVAAVGRLYTVDPHHTLEIGSDSIAGALS